MIDDDWAGPRSLATTKGISVDFCSSGYLDVSVLQVRFHTPMYSVWDTSIRGGFPHSDISGSKSVCRLPEAFRRLQRPSSPMIAKASTMCTYSLDSIALGTANLFRSTLHAPLQRILSFGEFDLFVEDDSSDKTLITGN